jgi:CheY-like chemotaxis protein
VALEELESARTIDLLITDIVMPERVNGIALSRMARMMANIDIRGRASVGRENDA